jgi:mannose-6-phosphate isomerase-like protein (cupin superfamily)
MGDNRQMVTSHGAWHAPFFRDELRDPLMITMAFHRRKRLCSMTRSMALVFGVLAAFSFPAHAADYTLKQLFELASEKHPQGRTEHQIHREVYRPWGKYDSVDAGPRYQVKRITVLPGAKLSVQMHHHRAEHWIVVSGTASVTLDGQDHLLTENESIYLPVGAVHALENPGKIPLELIEVQVGSYLGEDDIVRLQDRYGRV